MKFNSECDLLIGNRPENDSDEQCYECDDCHRYDICKKYYESRRIDRMSISEQINEIRNMADVLHDEKRNAAEEIMNQAADTIEFLSAKLQAANMERSVEDCGGWIPCKERLPEKYGDYLVAWIPLYTSMKNSRLPHYYEIVEYDPNDEALWIGGIDQAMGEYEIIAWRELPEPYHEP